MLYVDDEEELLDLGKLFLEDTKEFLLDTSLSAKNALNKGDLTLYDAIISDYQMPEMDGISFLKEVRLQFGNIPFILFTGRGREEVVIEALNNGADFYLQKGGEPESQFVELLHKMRIAIHRRWAEGELNQSEQRFRSAMNQLPGTTWAVDHDLRYTLSQGAGLAKLGLKPDQAVGMTLYEYFNTNDQSHPVISSHLRALTGESATYDFTHEGISFRTYLSPLYDLLGHITGVTGLAFDVTEQKRVEKELRESEKEKQDLIQNLHAGVVVHAPDTHILLANDQASKILGLTLDQMMGKTAFDPAWCFTREDGTKIPVEEYPVARVFATRSPLQDMVFGIIRPFTNDRVWVLVNAFPAFNSDGHVRHVVVTFIDITERKRAEEELRENEERYRLINDASLDFIYSYDREGRFTIANRALCEELHLEPDQITGRTHAELGFPDAQCREWDLLHRKVYETGKTVRSPTYTPMPDGTVHHYEVVLNPIRDNNGAIIGVSGTTRDITEQKRADDALRESEERYRRIIDTAQEGIWVVDSRYRTTFVNNHMAQLLGYAPDELMGRPVTDFIAQKDISDLERIASQRRKGTSGQFEREFIRKDGTVLWTLASSTPLFNKGEFAGSFAMFTDITEMKVAEEALRVSLIKYQALFDAFPLGITISDSEGNIVESNRTAEDLLGLSKDEQEKRQIDGKEWKIIQPDGSPLPPDNYASVKALKEHKKVSNVEMGIVKSEKDVTWISVTAAPLPLEGYGVAITYGDITERKKAEGAINKANRQLKLLGSITRHDIDNKITIILGYLNIAARKSKNSEVNDLLAKIKSATNAIQSEIAFTRVYQKLGCQAPQWQNVDPVLPRSQLPPGITLHADVTGIEVYADMMLEKVFFNFLDNTTRHGGPVSEIRVSSDQSDEGLTIIWEDNGNGIPVDKKEKIFERGFGKNTGLGLFLVREILLLTDITIRETGEPGKGARFEMIVPKGAYRVAGRI